MVHCPRRYLDRQRAIGLIRLIDAPAEAVVGRHRRQRRCKGGVREGGRTGITMTLSLALFSAKVAIHARLVALMGCEWRWGGQLHKCSGDHHRIDVDSNSLRGGDAGFHRWYGTAAVKNDPWISNGTTSPHLLYPRASPLQPPHYPDHRLPAGCCAFSLSFGHLRPRNIHLSIF